MKIYFVYFNFHKWCWIHLHRKHEHTAGETTCRSTEVEQCVCGGEVRRPYCEFTLRRKSRLTLPNQTSCPLPYLHFSLASVVLQSHWSLTSRCHHIGMNGGEKTNRAGVCPQQWNTNTEHIHIEQNLTCKHMPKTYKTGLAYMCTFLGCRPLHHSGTSFERMTPSNVNVNVQYKYGMWT